MDMANGHGDVSINHDHQPLAMSHLVWQRQRQSPTLTARAACAAASRATGTRYGEQLT
jgi:hypothetical protein